MGLGELFAEIDEGLGVGVEVEDGVVGDEGGLGDVDEGGDVFLEEGIVGGEAGNHQAVGIPPDRLLEDGS